MLELDYKRRVGVGNVNVKKLPGILEPSLVTSGIGYRGLTQAWKFCSCLTGCHKALLGRSWTKLWYS